MQFEDLPFAAFIDCQATEQRLGVTGQAYGLPSTVENGQTAFPSRIC